MQKTGIYLTLLVLGGVIGASLFYFMTLNQNPSITEQVKVTIERIEYDTGSSAFEIELLNDAPETDLDGKLVVSQAENEWTIDVNWHYSGNGLAEVICNGINETQNFNIKYVENSPKATYLDKTVEWDEIGILYFTFMETEEIQITSINFNTATNQITVNVQNTGTVDVTITSVTINGNGTTDTYSTGNVIFDVEGVTSNIVVDVSSSLSEGTAYTVGLISSKGNIFSYTATA